VDALAAVDARQRLARRIENGQSVLGVVLWLFEEHERLQAAAEMAERECAHLRQELAALRAEIGLTKVTNDALQGPRPPLGRHSLVTAARRIGRAPERRAGLLLSPPGSAALRVLAQPRPRTFRSTSGPWAQDSLL
jgi:hypothetical protein